MKKMWQSSSLDDQVSELSDLINIPASDIDFTINVFATTGGSIQNFVSTMLYNAYRSKGKSSSEINESLVNVDHLSYTDKTLVKLNCDIHYHPDVFEITELLIALNIKEA